MKNLRLINIPSHALQSEGIDAIIDTLKSFNLDGVTVFPSFYTEVNENGRWRLPPLLAKLERSVFGKESCRIERRSPFPHDEKYYCNTRVQPVKYKGHDDIWTPFIRACRQAGLKVFLAMVPTVAFDQMEEFIPRFVNGEPFEEYLGFLCPNNPEVMNYAIGIVRELADRYQDCDGVLLDHVEYPAYSLTEIFTCFCVHCQAKAANAGIDVKRAMSEATRLLQDLKAGLGNNDLKNYQGLDVDMTSAINYLALFPAAMQYLGFKIQTITNTHKTLVKEIRSRTKIRPIGCGGFAPSYAMFTGVDYRGIEDIYDFLCPKLYPPHWDKMQRKTLDELKGEFPHADIKAVAGGFRLLLGIAQANARGDAETDTRLLLEKEIRKTGNLIRKEFIPWIHCEGTAEALEMKLEALRKHEIKSAFFHEYMFLNTDKLNLIKSFIDGV